MIDGLSVLDHHFRYSANIIIYKIHSDPLCSLMLPFGQGSEQAMGITSEYIDVPSPCPLGCQDEVQGDTNNNGLDVDKCCMVVFELFITVLSTDEPIQAAAWLEGIRVILHSQD